MVTNKHNNNNVESELNGKNEGKTKNNKKKHWNHVNHVKIST